MSHPLLLSHLPFPTSTSSSSITRPSTTVHHDHLQALPVDKQRHQESLWRENLQSGGNPRTTTHTKEESTRAGIGAGGNGSQNGSRADVGERGSQHCDADAAQKRTLAKNVGTTIQSKPSSTRTGEITIDRASWPTCKESVEVNLREKSCPRSRIVSG